MGVHRERCPAHDTDLSRVTWERLQLAVMAWEHGLKNMWVAL